MKNPKIEKAVLYVIIVLITVVLPHTFIHLIQDTNNIVADKKATYYPTQLVQEETSEKSQLVNQSAFINPFYLSNLQPNELHKNNFNSNVLQAAEKGKPDKGVYQKIVQLFEAASKIKKEDLEMFKQKDNNENGYSGARRVIFQGFVIGSLFIIAVNHLVVFLHRKRELSAFFLSIGCFAFAIRLSFVGDFSFIFHIVYQVKPTTILYVDLISGLVAILFYFLFIDKEFNPKPNKKITDTIISLLTIYILSIVILPLLWSIQFFLIYQLLCLIILIIIMFFSVEAIRYKKKGSYINIAGLLILFLLLWNDVFVYSKDIPTEVFIFLGALIYLGMLSVHLSRKTSHSFNRTERLSLELQVFNDHLESKVSQRTEELQAANATLHEIEQERQRLLGNIAHELNTPLTFIKGYTNAMMNEIIPKDDSTYLRQVDSETKLMAQMIKDLQELYKLKSNQVAYQFQYVNIREFLIQSYESQKVLFNGTEIDYRFHEYVKEKSYFPVCLIDPIRIRQIINNLVVNARKFTDNGGTITMEVEIPSKSNKLEIEIKVIDTGSGISEEELPFIFDRFYKIENDEFPHAQGSGLGLVIAKEIIEAHKGTIGAKSIINTGSTFYFTLPIKG